MNISNKEIRDLYKVLIKSKFLLFEGKNKYQKLNDKIDFLIKKLNKIPMEFKVESKDMYSPGVIHLVNYLKPEKKNELKDPWYARDCATELFLNKFNFKIINDIIKLLKIEFINIVRVQMKVPVAKLICSTSEANNISSKNNLPFVFKEEKVRNFHLHEEDPLKTYFDNNTNS